MPDQPNDLTRKVFRAEIAAVNSHLAETGPSVPADADLRYQVLHALDFAYCNGIGYETPEQLLDAYDAHRPVLPAPADQAVVGSGRAAEAELYVLLRKAGEDRHAAQALIDQHRDEVLRRKADEEPQPEAEAPLSPYMSHPACGFHWHGRDGMDVPIRDGQPVCPRCELRRMADEARPAQPLAVDRNTVECALDLLREGNHITARLLLESATSPVGEAQQAETPKRPPMDPVHILGIGADEAQQASGIRRTLTPNEHDRAWYAIEGSAGEPGADPGTVLNAVLHALRIDAPTAEDEQAASPRRKADKAQQAEAGECNGICLYAADIGVPEAGDVVAYAHPDCPQHGEAQQAEPEPRVVAYRVPGARSPYCVLCARQESDKQPLTAADVHDDTACHFCGGGVLVVASQSLGDVINRHCPDGKAQQEADRA